MRTVRAWLMRLAGLVDRGRRDRELAAEIDSHLQLHIDDHVRAGMAPDEARRRALLAFGGVEAMKEEYRDRRGLPIADAAWQHLRQAVRQFRREPGFTLTAMLTLAVGVGVNTAMVGLVDALMFRPPDHIVSPDRLVSVEHVANYVEFSALRDRARTLDVAALTRPTPLSLGLGAGASEVRTECVTPGYFPLLGVAPAFGRAFTAADDRRGSPPTVLLSDGLWQRQFAGNPAAIGSTVLLAGRSYGVIGVAPRGFAGVHMNRVDAWILIAISPEACSFTGTNLLAESGAAWLDTIGRIRDGATLAEAEAEVASVDPEARRVGAARAHQELEPLYASRTTLSRQNRLALWLAGGAAIVLLVACANVAGLLSIRAIDRRREVAVRLQLGATRGHIVRQVLTEHLLLAAASAVVALGMAAWIGVLVEPFFPAVTAETMLNARLFAMLGVCALVAGLLSGVVPAIQTSRADATRLSRSGHAATREHSAFRSSLLVAQVALALALMVGAGLFVRSVANLRKDLGFDLDHVVVATVNLQKAGIEKPADVRSAFDLLLARVQEVPDVERASLTSGSILDTGGAMTVTAFSPDAISNPLSGATVTQVSTDYFSTLGTRILRGRAFTDADNASAAPVMIVSESLARESWPGEEAVGKCEKLGRERTCTLVVGVSESRRLDSMTETSRELFVPMAQSRDMSEVPQMLLVRPRTSPRRALASIAAAVRGASPTLPFVDVRPLSDLANDQTQSWRLGAAMFGLFGAAAVALAAIGIYASLAFSIRRRTTEIGIRMALGAMPGDIVRTVMRRGLALVGVGWAIGAIAAFWTSRSLDALLFGVGPYDAATFAAASAVVILAGLAGCLVPAARAVRVDPVIALRHE
jgi:predicted permease